MAEAPARTVSNPGALRAVSAAREKPLEERAQGPLKERLRSEATNAALNAVAILKEAWEDFRNSDRFFKYKAGILATWLVLSVVTLFLARPSLPGPVDNALDARLVVAPSGERLVYMLQNESKEPWTEVTLVANGKYRATAKEIAAGKDQVFTTDKFVDGSGNPAPAGLYIQELKLKTAECSATLMKDGKVVE